MRRPDSAAFAQALADPPALLSQPPSLLSDEQLDALDHLIEPLSPDQLIWIGGYLAGLASAHRTGTPRLAPAPAERDDQSITVVYGSQSGNGARIAADVKAHAEAKGLGVRIKSMDEYRPSELRNEKRLLIVVSTQGEGEPPDTGKELHEFLHGRKAGKLDGLRYSVLAL